jgi:acetyl-CoA acetyltransferase
MSEALIVSAVRTGVGKAPNGTLRTTRPDEMAAVAIAEAVRRATGLDPAEVEDVVLGCAMPEAEQGMNVARIASLRAGLPDRRPADHDRRRRRHRRRRHRVDEPGADGRSSSVAEPATRHRLR